MACAGLVFCCFLCYASMNAPTLFSSLLFPLLASLKMRMAWKSYAPRSYTSIMVANMIYNAALHDFTPFMGQMEHGLAGVRKCQQHFAERQVYNCLLYAWHGCLLCA